MKLKPADFAREAGVTRQAVSAKIKNSTLIIDAAGFMDTENPINAAYISDLGRKSRKAAAWPPPVAAASPPSLIPQTEAEICAAAGVPAVELLSYTLREIVAKFNGLYNLEKHAKTLRDITMAAEKEQRMAERSLKLIEKDFVTSRLFQYVDVLMKQIIEYPEGVVDTLVAKVLSDGPDARGDLVIMLRGGLGRIIAGAKDQLIKELNGLKGKYAEADKLEQINEAIREAVAGE
ncbi:MAG: hypothetical protein LBS37_10120 [Treponema sp.]|jgi:hypothetical protein|nr:hypothetical protein [Treponema sp.]